MALIVKVFVNEREIIDTHVVRIKGQPHEMCTYKADNGDIIKHHYDSGAESLAIQMLDLYRRRKLVPR